MLKATTPSCASVSSSNHRWSDLRPILVQQTPDTLIKLIQDLHALSSTNKDFLAARFLKDAGTLDHYKAQIQRYVAPQEPWKKSQSINLKAAKKMISDYQKATNDTLGVMDLMVHYVECGTAFLATYGDMYEAYYISLESVFEHVLKLMKQHDLDEIYDLIERLKVVMRKANDRGWGYHDVLVELFNAAYPEEGW